MALSIVQEHLNGIVVLKSSVFEDERGYFMEAFHSMNLATLLNIEKEFIQDNHSRSTKNVIRGMHFQWEEPMDKLLWVSSGRIQLVEVDIRIDSPTYGGHVSIDVSDSNHHFVWIPAGFANGFAVLSDVADVHYKCTAYYNPRAESGIRWNDPAIGIEWNVENPIVSAKDTNAQTLAEWSAREEAGYFQYSNTNAQESTSVRH